MNECDREILICARKAVVDCGHFTGCGELERIVAHAIKMERKKLDIEILSHRLTEAMEGELEGLTTDLTTAQKIMSYVMDSTPCKICAQNMERGDRCVTCGAM